MFIDFMSFYLNTFKGVNYSIAPYLVLFMFLNVSKLQLNNDNATVLNVKNALILKAPPEINFF